MGNFVKFDFKRKIKKTKLLTNSVYIKPQLFS